MSGDGRFSSRPPAGPLELQCAVINRVLGVGVCITRPRTPFGLSCESDFSVRLEAIGCSRARLSPLALQLVFAARGLTSRAGPLSRVVSQSLSMLGCTL